MTAAATESKRSKQGMSGFPSFTIQADHPQNCDLLLQSLRGVKLRSTIKSSWLVSKLHGREGEKEAVSHGGLPPAEGMFLHVYPEELRYEVVDPLYNNRDACNMVRTYLKRLYNHSVPEIVGSPPISREINADEMKTLCRECVRLVELGDAKHTDGALPTESDLEDMPGDFLQNPLQLTNYGQPRYEKDMDRWQQNQNRRK